MSKFNFDFLFDGSITQQAVNVHNFMHGISAAQRDNRRNLALAILRGDGALNYIKVLGEIDEMIIAFGKDPRTVALAAYVEEENKKRTKEAREDLGHQIAEELAKVL